MERAPRHRLPSRAVRPAVEAALAQPAGPLPPAVRAPMEARFGHSFADVRVHADAPASVGLGAEAFTVGTHIAFAPGAFAPGTARGDRLLAHELAHVVQGDGAAPRLDDLALSAPDAAHEVEAEAAADAVAAGGAAPALAASSAGQVSRSLMDWMPYLAGDWGRVPTRVDDAPGTGTQPGPYYYANEKQTSLFGVPLGGLNYGGGNGHAQGELPGRDVFSPGDSVSLSGTYDASKVEGHLGAWDVPTADGGHDTNIGFALGGKTPSASVTLAGTNAQQQGGSVTLDGNGPNFDVSSYIGTGGFNFGMQAGVGGANLTSATTGTSTDELAKVGLSEGVGAAARGFWGDGDHDGFREYGFGFDYGPLSVDLKTEDPLRTGLRNALPLGMLYSDALLGEGNATENLANQFGLSTKNADLSTTWDLISGGAEGALEGLNDSVEDGFATADEWTGGALSSADDFLSDIDLSDIRLW